ncbi:hypothetical protein PS862_00199 [Pseudomonas fluorescens]|uniref:Uncharacterized protein n=1 Tax=Pseudomonas fluorescens TaxID=294 RepID=A0A5E7GAJ3_PSEFL|nr:hypothetical protein PS862_00199 [Pseudomonas fluorescens]
MPLVDTGLCRMTLVVVIKRDQEGGLRVDVLPPLFLDLALAKLGGGLWQREVHDTFEFVAHLPGRRRMRAGYFIMRELFHGAIHCS